MKYWRLFNIKIFDGKRESLGEGYWMKPKPKPIDEPMPGKTKMIVVHPKLFMRGETHDTDTGN